MERLEVVAMHRPAYIALFVCALPFIGSAQQALTGTITGAVTDASQAAIPKAQVTARNVNTGLERSATSYYFYTTVARLFLHNRLIREDGALSILKSFTPAELEALGKQAGLDHMKVEKHFPGRLILSTIRAVQNTD